MWRLSGGWINHLENSTCGPCFAIRLPRWSSCQRLAPVFGKAFPKTHPTLVQLELTIRLNLNPAEAYNMVPGRDPDNG